MAKHERQQSEKRIVTPPAVVSYPALFTPDAYKPGDDPKYKCDLLFDKKDPKVVAWIKSQMKIMHEMAKVAWSNPNLAWKDIQNPFNDGDLKESEEYHGHFFIVPKTKYAPQVVLQDPTVEATESDIYGGAIVRASLVAFTYHNGQNRGISFRLGNVQKVSDGQAFGGSRSVASDDFDTLEAPEADFTGSTVDESTPFGEETAQAENHQAAQEEDFELNI